MFPLADHLPLPASLRPTDVPPLRAAGDPFGPLLTSVRAIESEPPAEPIEEPRNRLNEIATLVHSLTYGEMMELAEAIWKLRPEAKELNGETLALTLHAWSKSHG